MQLLPHQRNVRMQSNSLLLYHSLGSGKTCTSIALAYRNVTGFRKIVVIAPASLVLNFQQEIRGACGRAVRTNNDNLFETRFWVVSKDKLYHDYKERPNELCNKLKNTVIIVDEVHRLLSYVDGKQFTFFEKIFECVRSQSKLILLSATPITDPYKMVPLARFLFSRGVFAQTPFANVSSARKFFDRYYDERTRTVKNKHELVDIFRGHVSYYNRSSRGFPEIVHHDVHVRIPENTTQHKAYATAMGFINIRNESFTQEFLLSARQVSNFVLPNGKVGPEHGMCCRTRDQLKDISVKFHKCLESIHARKGPFFVYSNFVNESGINAFAHCLETLYNYTETLDLPFRKYVVLRANDSPEERLAKINRFNHIRNADGRDINIIIGSPSSNEGISLKKLREIHILDPHWTPTTTDQIVGRGARYDSHTQVDYNEVHVFHYYAVPQDRTLLSVDTHLKKLQKDKRNLLNMFESVLQDASLLQPTIEQQVIHLNRVQESNENEHPVDVEAALPRRRDKRLHRITKLADYNPRMLNYKKRPKKKQRVIINLTQNNNVI